MRLCDEVITVFNAWYDADNDYDIYIPTVISGVSWYCEIASNVDSSGLKAADKFIIRIPVDAVFSGKSYVSPQEYKTAATQSAFTLQQGDIIIHGAEDQWLTPAQLRAKYGSVVTILGVTDNRRAPNAKHWKVVGA